jgi:hypothetical protein
LGTVALALVLVVCVAGTAAGVIAWRSAHKPEPSVTPSTPITPSATPASPSVPKSPADCLLGDWQEVTFTNTANLFGARVQLSGKGTLMRFNGTEVVIALENIVLSGSADGDNYEVIHSGGLKLNYIVSEDKLLYSNPQATGTTTWKVNGSTEATEPLKASLKPETFHCQGNDLRLFGEDSASELKRIVPPGTQT